MTEEQIDNIWKKFNAPERLLLKDIKVIRGDFTFDVLKTRLASQGIHINEKTFVRNYNLITEDGKYSKLCELLTDENRIGLAVCIFKGKDKVDYLKRNEYGNVSLILLFQRVFEYCKALNAAIYWLLA